VTIADVNQPAKHHLLNCGEGSGECQPALVVALLFPK
jgi:hypothetical protein